MSRQEAGPGRRLGLTSGQWVLALTLFFLLALELAPRLGIVESFSLPPLSTMLIAAGELLGDAEFWSEHMLPTLAAVVVAFVAASVLGVLFGVLLWRWPMLRRPLDPWFSIYYAIPTFALYPILAVLVGVGTAPVVMLATLLAIVSVITATLDGLDATPKSVLKLAASLELGPARTMTKVLLPSAFRQIVVGLRLGVSFSIIGVMASEFILSTRGLGYFISFAYDHFALPRMYGAVLLVLVIAIGANLVIGMLIGRRERRVYG